MSGKQSHRQIFNPELKYRFIRQFQQSTQNNYEYVLSKSYNMEREKNKDLCQFNMDELDTLFGILNAKSFQSIQYQWNIVNNYIEFATDECGYGNINFAKTFMTEELHKYINKVWTTKKIVTKDELYDLCGDCESPQDRVIFSLLFEGCTGGENFEELINLTIDDVDENNNILALSKNDGQQRQIEVSQECIDIVLEAGEETTYLKGNGEVSENIKAAKQLDLVDTKHIIKPSKRRDSGYSATPGLIRQRFNKIKKAMDNPYLTPTSIMISGMIDYAKKLKEEKLIPELTTDDYKDINMRFGLNQDNYYTTKKRIKDYI